MSGALRAGEDVEGGVRIDEEGMVYQLADGSVRYFQDKGRKYPFSAGPESIPLLRGLLAVNVRVNQLSQERVDETGNAAAVLREGEHLYVDKPTMKSSKGCGTWSDDEYAHPGLQAIYLRLKSFQRFTESWALYERAARRGTFDRYLQADSKAGSAAAPLRAASLGGGPGYELLALEWFLRFWAAVGDKSREEGVAWLLKTSFGGVGAPATSGVAAAGAAAAAGAPVAEVAAALAGASLTDGDALPAAPPPVPVPVPASVPPPLASTPAQTNSAAPLPPLHLVSLDLQPTWERYVKVLKGPDSAASYSFAEWDVHAGVEALERSAAADAACTGLELCVISNVLVYCTDEQTADVLSSLIIKDGVHAILINERGAPS